MHPFFFGPSSEPLFGIYEAPKLASSRGVLICPPLAQEHLRTHRALKGLGKQLALANFHVLRFDYFGTGDSAGASGEGSLARWIEDTQGATQELASLGSLKSISVVGLRFGATIAALTATRSPAIDTLVLWDPVCSGRQYLADLAELHRGALRDPLRFPEGRPSEPDQLVGFAYPPRLRENLAAVDLASSSLPACHKLVLVSDAKNADTQRLFNAYRSGGLAAEWVDIAENGTWQDPSLIEETLLVPENVRKISSLLVDAQHA